MNETQLIDRSSTVEAAAAAFLASVQLWVREATQTYATAPALDVHDQATFTTGWEPYIRATGDEEALCFLQQLRDRIRDHYVATGQWHHGYWTMQEAHHGTEHYELFLGMLARLAPDDPATVAQLVDVAEHLGNWVPAVEPWFDWDQGVYHSFRFGSTGVEREPSMALNMPDHFRCINIALLAHRATNDARYLDLATVAGQRWATAILAEADLPIGLVGDRAIYRFTPTEERLYRTYVGQSSALQDATDRAESFLASDAINALLYLWQATTVTAFRQAAERLLDLLAPTLADADAGAVADAIRHYRQYTGADRYDAAVRAAVATATPAALQHIGVDLAARPGERPAGVGKREDMLLWREDDQPRRHNPITLAVAAEIEDDPQLATHALDLAHAYLQLARRCLPDGRTHGCAARTVSAVARGHGRENHAGMTTAVLGPLLQRFCAPQRSRQ